MYFSGMLLNLKLVKHRRVLSTADCVYAHAAVLKRLSNMDQELGRTLHDTRSKKHMTLAIIASTRKSANLRLTFMNNEGLNYAQMLANSFSKDSDLRFKHTICEIESIDTTKSPWAGVRTWHDFFPETTGQNLHFQFVTPTAITKKSCHRESFVSLFPEPADIFMNLERRWKNLGGPPLVSDLNSFVRTGGCVVSRHQLRTVEFHTPDRTQIGYVGSVVYECCAGDHEYTVSLNALTHLAQFVGLGYQTARGMGTVRTRIY